MTSRKRNPIPKYRRAVAELERGNLRAHVAEMSLQQALALLVEIQAAKQIERYSRRRGKAAA